MCPSAGPSVGPFVGPSVHLSVRLSVRPSVTCFPRKLMIEFLLFLHRASLELVIKSDEARFSRKDYFAQMSQFGAYLPKFKVLVIIQVLIINFS